VEAGGDGANPVSPENPPAAAVIGEPLAAPVYPEPPPPLEFEEPDVEEGQVLTTTAQGEPVAVEAGMDGENPVSAENPPKSAVLEPTERTTAREDA
jgi:hypothetical protein